MDVQPIDHDAAAVGVQLAADQLQQRGLAGAGRAHDRGDPTSLDVEIDLVEDAPAIATKTQSADLDQGFRAFGAGIGPAFARGDGVGIGVGLPLGFFRLAASLAEVDPASSNRFPSVRKKGSHFGFGARPASSDLCWRDADG